ncbi:hypothetical protein WR25_11328 [Diploscapter pachys]|uniref:Uncharacterized protein n=1 Tax=Diploscapter pachys TaxID=2018661 RepID=A0A2A2JIM0_9BILA|nr:hypothetical protein WR25_11328 [Diploscapter pachys]
MSNSPCHYAQPEFHTPSGRNSANTSRISISSQERSIKARPIVFPSVNVSVQHEKISSISPNTSPVPYAVPVTRSPNNHYSSIHLLQFDHMRSRCRLLDEENQKLMRTQAHIVQDANRRVGMHLNEIRMLKEENKRLTNENKELKDMCCYFDNERQKTRRLAKEWQKFARYTSTLMKEEMQRQQKKRDQIEEQLYEREKEIEELKHLCLYLDEQRQNVLGTRKDDEESDDLGCGSSERSACSEDRDIFNQQKENTLRMITEEMTSLQSSTHERRDKEVQKQEDILIYIHTLEERIKQLEDTQSEPIWRDASHETESEEKTIVERWEEEKRAKSDSQLIMGVSTASTMTSSGTTYGSSEVDGDSTVYVMGDEMTESTSCLEVRPLSRIDEEDKSLTDIVAESSHLPPPVPPLSSTSSLFCQLSKSQSPLLSTDASFISNSAATTASSIQTIRAPYPLWVFLCIEFGYLLIYLVFVGIIYKLHLFKTDDDYVTVHHINNLNYIKEQEKRFIEHQKQMEDSGLRRSNQLNSGDRKQKDTQG